MNTLYKTEVSVRGGSNAQVASADKTIELDLRLPKSLGGPGGATNAEQLFAAAFGACLSSALSAAGQETGLLMPHAPRVESVVELAKSDTGAYSMAVTLKVDLPGVEGEKARALVERAREIWPWRDTNAVKLEVETPR